jgi:hypothetical protein
VKPVGAIPNGSLDFFPNTVAETSTLETSRKIRGTNCTFSKAKRALFKLDSESAAPSV